MSIARNTVLTHERAYYVGPKLSLVFRKLPLLCIKLLFELPKLIRRMTSCLSRGMWTSLSCAAMMFISSLTSPMAPETEFDQALACARKRLAASFASFFFVSGFSAFCHSSTLSEALSRKILCVLANDYTVGLAEVWTSM